MSDADLTPRPLARFVCFGEVLLRLSAPDHELLLQTPRLRVHVGGAEANVAVSLARLGHRASMVTVLPDNPLGAAGMAELRRQGVGTEGVRFAPGRMGLYFLTPGAGHRPSEVLYDRQSSVFALAAPGLIDWDAVLSGNGCFHLSGITPAVSPQATEAALRAARAARAREWIVSFDCNYRAQLWDARPGEARPILREMATLTDLLFASERDMALILDRAFDGDPAPQRFSQAAAAMMEAFPQLQQVATTLRAEHSSDSHELSGLSASRTGTLASRTYSIGRIIDRIGSGDAFAAGLLHGLATGLSQMQALEFAVAAACLKHSIPGDFNLVSHAEVESLVREAGFTVRR